MSYWIRAESEQDLSTFKTSTRSSPLTCEMPMISLKESNVNNNLSLEERVNWLNTEVIAMQSFIVDQVLILKQSLKYSTLEKSPSDISLEVKRLEEVNDIPRQQNESLLQENSSKNAIIQLLIKNQEYLNKSVCNWNSVLDVDEIFKTVPKGPLKQGNNTETSRINCSNRFEVFSTTDDDDDNDSKSGKSDNIIVEESLTNDDVRNRKNKIQKSCITNRKHKKTLSMKNDTQPDHNRPENIKAVSGTNKITNDHHENRLNVNRMTSTYSNVVRNKKKNIVLFTDSILKTLRMGELNRHINGGKVHLKSFPGSKANQLNHHTIPILEEYQYDAAVIHVGVSDLLKGMPNNVTVDSICNDILETVLRCRNHNIGEVFTSSVA